MKNNINNELDNDSYPFEEEFSPESVVNRNKSADFSLEDWHANDEEQAQVEYLYISKRELANILADNPEIVLHKKDKNGDIIHEISDKHSSLQNMDSDELIEISIPINKNLSNIAKKNYEEDITDSYEFSELEDDDNYYITEEERQRLQHEEEKKRHLKNFKNVAENFREEEYEHPDAKFAKYVRKNFADYLSLPVISGSAKKKYSDKYIPKEFVENTSKHVEIADLDASTSHGTKKTSILINRDETDEIESIEVLCKCGERTLIKFDFDDSDEDSNSIIANNTRIIIDNKPEFPLSGEVEE